MCLAIPGKVLTIAGDEPLMRTARVDFGGIVKEINLAFTPEAGLGDYVLVHAGFAIQKIDEEVALDSMNLIREYAEALEDYEERMPEQPRSIFEA